MANIWTMSKQMSTRPSAILGLDGLEAYALDSAVVRWGTAFDAAIEEAGRDAKDASKADLAIQRVIRRWIPSERRYADPRNRS
jgi:hypothetical protein